VAIVTSPALGMGTSTVRLRAATEAGSAAAMAPTQRQAMNARTERLYWADTKPCNGGAAGGRAEHPRPRVPLGVSFTAFAPGRVNLIGEHTDYNDGLCLPFAIERGVRVTAKAADGRQIEARAHDLGEEDRFPLQDPGRAQGWRAFVRGAAAELEAAGIALRPTRLEISGDLPRGAGLGSSAALSVATCLALCAAAGEPEPDRVELARLCSRVENHWVGAKTGLLDQLGVLFGREGHGVRIDMRTVEVTGVPIDLRGATLATLDSGARREVGASGYNQRREECRAACEALGVESLREAGGHAGLPEPLSRRVRHVTSENERVELMVTALREGDLEEMGRLLDASHASLRDDYEVSVAEVESTLERAKGAGAIGARIHGGGFGGHVLALFPPGGALPDGAVPVSPSAGARIC
jgi:galactokinase